MASLLLLVVGVKAARAARRPGASTAPAVGHAGVGLGVQVKVKGLGDVG